MTPSPPPRVRVVVLNWNAAWFTRRCLSALEATEYPAERFEVVLVDNGSIDGSLEQLRYAFPKIRVIANETNLGFAEGCNRGMRDLDQVDAVALVNNDAVPEPGWLWPLVKGLQSARTVGAVAAGLVLEPAFTRVELSLIGGQAQIESLCIGPIEVLDRAQSEGIRSVGHPDWPMDLDYFLDGSADDGSADDGRAHILVPAGEGERVITLRVSGRGRLTASTSVDQVGVELTRNPSELSLRAGEDRTELLNGLGTDLKENSEGFDLHFGQPAQMLTSLSSETVFGFCGGGVLLRTAMLKQVGLFDPRFFAYYEDTDLAWRAQRAGWHTVTAPDSVIRHSFGASAAATSPGFFVHVYRNWLITVLRNGEPRERTVALRSLWERMKWAVRANIFSRLKHGHLPTTKLVLAWKRVLWSSLIELPYLARMRSESIGGQPTTKLRSPLRPRPAAKAPESRPGGPLIVYLDINQNPPRAAQLLSQLPTIDSRIDLVPLACCPESPVGYRRASAREIGTILGLPGKTINGDLANLRLPDFALGSAMLRLDEEGLRAGAVTRYCLDDVSREVDQLECSPSEVEACWAGDSGAVGSQLKEFCLRIIQEFGLP